MIITIHEIHVTNNTWKDALNMLGDAWQRGKAAECRTKLYTANGNPDVVPELLPGMTRYSLAIDSIVRHALFVRLVYKAVFRIRARII